MLKIMLSRVLGEKRWNQAMLSRATGIRAATIHAIYHEDIDRIGLEHLSKICTALECNVSDILVLTPDNRTQAKTKKI